MDLNRNLSVVSCGSCWVLLDASGKVSMELQRRSPVLARRDDWKVGQPSRVVVVRTRLVAFGDLVSSSKFPILKVLTGTLGAEVAQAVSIDHQ
jgi:hypothetical protein